MEQTPSPPALATITSASAMATSTSLMPAVAITPSTPARGANTVQPNPGTGINNVNGVDPNHTPLLDAVQSLTTSSPAVIGGSTVADIFVDLAKVGGSSVSLSAIVTASDEDGDVLTFSHVPGTRGSVTPIENTQPPQARIDWTVDSDDVDTTVAVGVIVTDSHGASDHAEDLHVGDRRRSGEPGFLRPASNCPRHSLRSAVGRHVGRK